MKKKKGFFRRLAGAIQIDDRDFEDELAHYDDSLEDYDDNRFSLRRDIPTNYYDETEEAEEIDINNSMEEYSQPTRELDVDVYETGDAIVVRTAVAGIHPDDVDVSITRETVTIRGRRDEDSESANAHFVHQELYWGDFSRTITLPAEIIIEEAEAIAKHGLLTIRLPKIDRDREARIKVRLGQ